MIFFTLLSSTTLAEEQNSEEMRVSDLSFSERFSLGTQLYHTGDLDSALKVFVELANEASIPLSLKQEARVYIAELHYVSGNKEKAQGFFEQIVASDPEYQIDRFKHPPDVCGLFDFVKTYHKPASGIPSPVNTSPRPFPLKGYSPLAIYQLQYQPLPKGLILTSLQIGAATMSITTYVQLSNDHSYTRGDQTKKNMLDRRLTIQRVSTVAFYSLWAASVFDAQRHWNLNLSLMPTDDDIQPTIGIQQRF